MHTISAIFIQQYSDLIPAGSRKGFSNFVFQFDGMIELPWQNKHFYHRAGFGTGLRELSMSSHVPMGLLLDETIQNATRPLPRPDNHQAGSPILDQPLFGSPTVDPRMQKVETMSSQLDRLRAEWINIMAEEQWCFREKMSLFWHGHFACQCTSEITASQYLDAIRRNALGNFGTILREVAKSPAMILFLNNQQNRKDHPNENFARELMELFTLGRGTYDEQDVREGARAFTGWSTDHQGRFVFRENNHDFGFKEFLGKRGRFDGDDIIDIILQHPETPRFLATKIYQHFVHEQTDAAAISQIARQIQEHHYEMAEVMHFVFSSEFFYQKQNIGTRIKSPIELLVQITRLFKIRFIENHDLAFLQKALGQLLFDPPNVAGWQGGRSWINNSTLMLRLNLARYLVDQERFDHSVATPLEAMASNSEFIQVIAVEQDLNPLIELFSGIRYQELERTIKNALITTEASPSIVKSRDFKEMDLTRKLLLRTISLPEFQMC